MVCSGNEFRVLDYLMIELECGTPINHLSIEWVNLSEYGMHERFGSRVLTLSEYGMHERVGLRVLVLNGFSVVVYLSWYEVNYN
jgi:hypothetical protein